MRRHILGIITLLLLVAAAGLWLWERIEGPENLPGGYEPTAGFCARIGAILAIWWLAYPDLARLPVWLLALAPAIVIIAFRWPKFLLLLIPVLVVIAILRPRRRR